MKKKKERMKKLNGKKEKKRKKELMNRFESRKVILDCFENNVRF